jgi:hypothetical protein
MWIEYDRTIDIVQHWRQELIVGKSSTGHRICFSPEVQPSGLLHYEECSAHFLADRRSPNFGISFSETPRPSLTVCTFNMGRWILDVTAHNSIASESTRLCHM